MLLKKYQQKTLDELQKYISEMKKYDTDRAAGVAFMTVTDKTYNWVQEIGCSPYICIKVPTGGGKTFIAVHTVGIISKEYLGERNDNGLVMWFVPSDAIKNQTLSNLRNRKHPYREVLDLRFNNSIRVFDLTEAKSIKKDDLSNNLCIVVSTLSAFRRTDKEWLKAYQDNGALMPHFEGLDPQYFSFLDKDADGEILYSLVNVIKLHNPLVIVDEGHNVQTDLSFDMLRGINPSFVLEFTATPRGQSNVLISISAKELKQEKMIKMPIYLANKTPWQETIYAGIDKLKSLDKKATKNKGEYIRPIMLIQAEQEVENSNKVYVEKIKHFLIEEAEIPEDQIAIQTGKEKELPTMEILLGDSCHIRFIITVNALREGWDCPFAYVLVSVSNLGARLSVEQTIGRIMRLPKAEEKSDTALNSAYIFATTQSFSQTSEMVIKGLQENGYTDVVPIAGGATVPATEYKKVISDGNISIPLINIKDGERFRRLDYVTDLIGGENVLKDQDTTIDFQPIDDTRIVKIDIGNEGELVKDAAGNLGLVYHCNDYTENELLVWFRSKIQRGFIGIEEMSSYLETVNHKLLNKYDLNVLSSHHYQITESIEKKINEIVDKLTLEKFKGLTENQLLTGRGESRLLDDTINMLQPESYNFEKHLYEKAGKMNNEEMELAQKLDTLENVRWWFRNPEIGGFYIQGWRKQKFYPDFIVKTKKGNCVVMEYKGEHLIGSDDSDYKEALGKEWERLCGTGFYFRWLRRNTVDNVVHEISNSL